MSKGRNIQILGIDFQNDFCDPRGSLYVAGAEKDCDRAAALITKLAPEIQDIHLTLDSHHLFDVAHPLFWKDKNGKHPDPFTMITEDDVANGVWRATVPNMQGYALSYVTQLAKNKRYALIVWPPHCLIGSWGAGVMPSVFDAVSAWEQLPASVNYVTKGSNFKTEHYSAVQADVPDPQDPGTQLNIGLIKVIQEADDILFMGEAKNFCVAHTGRDIVDNFSPDAISKIVLILDCMSNVPNQPGGPDLEALGEQFINDMVAKGCRTALSTDF